MCAPPPVLLPEVSSERWIESKSPVSSVSPRHRLRARLDVGGERRREAPRRGAEKHPVKQCIPRPSHLGQAQRSVRSRNAKRSKVLGPSLVARPSSIASKPGPMSAARGAERQIPVQWCAPPPSPPSQARCQWRRRREENSHSDSAPLRHHLQASPKSENCATVSAAAESWPRPTRYTGTLNYSEP